MFNIHVLVKFMNTYKYNILVFVLLFAFSLLFRFSLLDESILKNIVFASLNAFLLQLIVILFSTTILRIPVVVILSFLVSVDIALFYIYGGPMNYSVLASIAETSMAEIHGMGQLVLPAGIISFIVFIFLLNKSTKETKNSKRSVLTNAILIGGVIFGIFIFPVLFNFSTFIRNISLTTTYSQNLSTTAYYSSVVRFKYPFVIGDMFIAAAYIDEMSKFSREMQKPKVLPQGVLLSNEENIADKIIFVIGESATSSHFSLYGYDKETTPFADSLSQIEPNVLSYYRNVISPACATRDALRIALSFSSVRDFRPFIEEMNLIDLAQHVGFETVWISNQNTLSWYENYTNMISFRSDTCVFRSELYPEDLDLVPIMESLLKPHVKQLLVLHLEGSHMPYHKRYDKKDTGRLGDRGETIDYDKSILHTDRVLEEIYKVVFKSHENIVLFYFSDHGEKVNKGHAFIGKWKMQYQIPLLTMQNKPFINTDSIICKYYDEETGLLNSSSNIFIMAEMLGYQIADSLIQESKTEGRYVYQPDGTHCLYENIKD